MLERGGALGQTIYCGLGAVCEISVLSLVGNVQAPYHIIVGRSVKLEMNSFWGYIAIVAGYEEVRM